MKKIICLALAAVCLMACGSLAFGDEYDYDEGYESGYDAGYYEGYSQARSIIEDGFGCWYDPEDFRNEISGMYISQIADLYKEMYEEFSYYIDGLDEIYEEIETSYNDNRLTYEDFINDTKENEEEIEYNEDIKRIIEEAKEKSRIEEQRAKEGTVAAIIHDFLYGFVADKEEQSEAPKEEPAKKITKSWKMQDTERSTCFSQVGYDFDNEELHLVFRESGKEYIYSEFPEKDWSDFWNAESLGSYYNKWIKGKYPSRKVN